MRTGLPREEGSSTGLRRAPAFTLTATITRALGIGGATAAFGVIHGVRVKPLGVSRRQRAGCRLAYRPGGNVVGPVEMAAALYFTYLDDNRTFDAFGVWNRDSPIEALRAD
jgi:hypothetical protein